ncbi:MAG TPA: dolichol-phosphate mannosyltransferase, partial [Rhodospirillaceae bacterium]|nr:dolichol-phosphate mannosyltransferase [Rhodospirillaceae bacterium]
DGQNDPADIRLLWEHYQATGAAVMGQRAVRRDNFVRRWSSKVANALRRAMLRDGVRDTGCSLKLIPTAAYRALPYFDHMHRFLPALLLRAHVPVEAVDVSHRPRERGASKYGFWGRLWVGVFDVLGVWWLSRRALPPVAVQEC